MVRDLQAKRGGYSTNSYLKVLEQNISIVYHRGMWFMQDNAPIHTANKVKDWFEAKRIKVLDWPPYSPDLSGLNLRMIAERFIALCTLS